MVFRLAAMSGLILGMTCALLLIPIGFLAAPLSDPRHFPLALLITPERPAAFAAAVSQ